ncbi:fatty acid--CoA ligase family protein [Nocardia fusca]|uniref:fatty acid--CoA ligase family protein n=1 Tax=Nocardia fusca TaxID=941183 RepID=UPI0037971CC5
MTATSNSRTDATNAAIAAQRKFENGMRQILALRPSAGAIQSNEIWSTWAQLDGMCALLRRQLESVPTGPVTLVMRNRPSGVAALLGLLMAGRTTYLVSPIQAPDAIANDVLRSNAGLVVADTDDWSPALHAVVDQLGWKCELSRTASGTLGATSLCTAKRDAAGNDSSGETALIVPTSGTTGVPKRIAFAWQDLPQPQERVSEEVVINGMSCATITGLMTVLRAVASGRPLALLERLEIHAWVGLVREHRPRLAGLPPAAMRSLLDASINPADLASIEAWPTGSAPVPPALQEEFERYFHIPVLVKYGATEFGGVVAGWTLEDHARWATTKRGSVGRARSGVRLRVVDPATGDVLPSGHTGLLEVISPLAPGQTDGWVRTNDLADLDEDGFLYIRGRTDDVIVRGGFKVPLGELEEILLAHPAVLEAGAVGLSDERLGQVPAAAVTLGVHAFPPSEQDLKDWVRARTAPYKVPVRVRVVDALPQTASMKVSRPGLRQLLEQEDGRHATGSTTGTDEC